MWLNDLGRRWMGQAPRQLQRRGRQASTRTRLTVEALEDRTLLSNPATTGDLISAINSATSEPRTWTGLTVVAVKDRTLIVDPATTGDLIAAINSANSSGSATTITLAAGATFDFTSAIDSTNGANALPVITGKITIVGNNDTIERTGSSAF